MSNNGILMRIAVGVIATLETVNIARAQQTESVVTVSDTARNGQEDGESKEATQSAVTVNDSARGGKEDGESKEEPQCDVTITDPALEGTEVDLSKLVKGEASIPSGDHVWVLTRREDFSEVWWPQAEGVIDPKTKEWKVQVTFGQIQDVGWNFDLAAIVVSDEEHIKLKNYRLNAMKSGEWLPIDMPPTRCAPKILKVKKTSHE